MKVLESILRWIETTHLHVVGATRTGKTKFLEWLLRNIIARTSWGVIVLDWHGTLAEPLLKFLAIAQPKRKVVYVDPSDPDWIIPLNFFHAGDGVDVATMVSRLLDATLAAWQEPNTNQMPRMERIMRATFHFVVTADETLPNAELLLQYPKKELRHYASEQVEDPYIREVWRELSTIASPRDWRDQVESSVNRLTRIVGPLAIRRLIGLRTGLDIDALLDENAIVILNLKQSDHLGTETARFFASLFIAALFSSALRRAGTKHRTIVACDEFQEFVTANIARSLDQAAKGGLRFILSHQRLGHLERDEELRNAVFTNAKIRVTFGGLEFGDACYVAQHDLLHEINSRQILETYKHTASKSHLEEFENEGVTEGVTVSKTPPDPQGLYDQIFHSPEHQEVTVSSHTSTQASVTRMLIPEYFEEVSGRAEKSRDEKLSSAAERLMNQKERECHLKLPDGDAFPFRVPEILEIPISSQRTAEYLALTYQEVNAIPADVADRLLEESRVEFIRKAQNGHKELIAVSKRPPRIPHTR